MILWRWESHCDKALNLCFHGLCCLPTALSTGVNSTAKPEGKVSLTPWTICNYWSANGTLGIAWVRIAVFTLNTYRNKQVKKPHSNNKRQTHKESQWSKSQWIPAREELLFVAWIPALYPCSAKLCALLLLLSCLFCYVCLPDWQFFFCCWPQVGVTDIRIIFCAILMPFHNPLHLIFNLALSFCFSSPWASVGL